MSTLNTKAFRQRRIVVGAVLAGAIAASALGAAATANARGPINPNPDPAQPLPAAPANPANLSTSIAFSAETGVWATWANAPTWQNADYAAKNMCQDRDGTNCQILGRAGNNQCVALAVDAVNWTLWHSGVGPTQISAETAALDVPDSRMPNKRIAAVACTTGGSPAGFAGHVDKPQWQ
jgi:hypothetical protein